MRRGRHSGPGRWYNRPVKFAPPKPSLLMTLTVGLLVLLPVLAVLQYRWMGQVSEGERERLQKNLREGATKFTQDFDREIARLFFSFQFSAFRRPTAPDEEFAACYARWAQEAAFPGLLKDGYSIETDADGQVRLQRFDRATGRFQPATWEGRLARLRDRLQKQLQKFQFKLPSALADRPLPEHLKPDVMQIIRDEVDPVAADVPALVIHRMPVRFGDEVTAIPLRYPTYLVLALDLDVIRRDLIPQLAASYFSGDHGLDYNLTIVDRREPAEVIYRSDDPSDEAALAPSPDAVANLFMIRFNEVNTIVRQQGQAAVSEEQPKKAVAIQVFRSDSVVTPGAPRASLFAAENGAWQLLLKHRSGSLGAVVASARRRNLAISFGILLMLAVSVGMILLSTRRAGRLARQQMEFVAGVSHELRTPLAVIRSAGENLADGVIDEREQIKRYGSLIAGEGRRLTEMVEQILEFSGIQSGRQNYLLRPTDVGRVVENAVAACWPMATENGFEIRQEIAPQLPEVAADEAALSRSLQNLLTNAMKYSGDSQAIEIKAAPTPRGEKPAGVRLTIIDHGLGIDAEDLPHIFEPFYRGREATEAQIHGSGLGLSLVKQIVEAHAGQVSVTTTKGKGSAFTIHLPSLASPASPARLASPASPLAPGSQHAE